jgi:GxxExxY protein
MPEGDEVDENVYSKEIIGAAIEVHRELGPGLLESAYEGCLAYRVLACGIPFERQKELPVEYKGVHNGVGYRLDFLVGGLVVVELKSVESLHPVHDAQLLTYLKLTDLKLGLLLNFNVTRLRFEIKRMVNGLLSNRESAKELKTSAHRVIL